MASAVTDLPQPDLPTRQCVSPRSTVKDAPRTAETVPAERDLQPIDLEKRAHGSVLAPNMSRNPSPNKLMPSTSTNSATPGTMITHGLKNM